MPSIILLIAFAQSSAADDRPAALVRAYESRLALERGQAEFVVSMNNKPPRYYTGRFGGPDDMMIERGDTDGLFFPGESGERIPYSWPYHVMWKDGRVWLTGGPEILTTTMERTSDRAGYYRVRSLGLGPALPMFEVEDALWNDFQAQASPRRYSTRTEDGLEVVTAESDALTTTWWIDPRRGWQPVRVTCTQEGITAEARITLRQFDGVWFPDSVAYSHNPEKGGQPYAVIHVESLKVNQPDMPARLTLLDMGIDVGEHVNCCDDHMQNGVSMVLSKNGLVTPDEFLRQYRAGEVAMGEVAILRNKLHAETWERQKEVLARARAANDGKADSGGNGGAVSAVENAETRAPRLIVESEWETYTRRFIERFALNDEQRQQALRFLSQAQEAAHAYVERRKDDFQKVEQEAERIGKLAATERHKPLAELAEVKARLMKPIDEIFEKSLKGKLETLPTRVQREAEAKSGGRVPPPP